MVRDAVETSRALASKRDVSLEAACDETLPALHLDEVKMRQVVVNLLVNAVKFSPSPGVVRVSTARDGDFARIEVKDDGPGVRPEDATLIFELFGQGVQDGASERGGLGIGLHLVRRISELHGGHVGVNSPPGQGSTFWVRLPLALAHTMSPKEASAEAA
jgi:signal transduction histidine kinase